MGLMNKYPTNGRNGGVREVKREGRLWVET